MKCLLLSLLACLAVSPALAADSKIGDPLDELQVTIDDVPMDVGLVVATRDAFFVDMESTLKALIGQGSSIKSGAGDTVSILVNGTERVRFHTALGSDIEAICLDDKGQTVRKIKSIDYLPMKDSDGRWKMEAGSLAEVLGDSAEIDSAKLKFFTPVYWATALGIDPEQCRGLKERSVGAGLALGVSPPSDEMVVWLRPASEGFVQEYSMGDTLPKPMLGRDAGGHLVDNPSEDQAVAEKCSLTNPARAITQYVRTGDSPPAEGHRYGLYAAVYTAKNPIQDPLQAVKSGDLKNDWFVVGARQLRVPSPLSFKLASFDGKTSFEKFSDANLMESSLLLRINGFGDGEAVPPKTRLLVMSKEVAPLKDGGEIKPGETYEVGIRDSLKTLAKKWSVSEEDIVALNDDIMPGQALEPGTILVAPVGKPKESGPGTAPPMPTKHIGAPGSIKAATFLRQTSAPDSPKVASLGRGLKLVVRYQVGTSLYMVDTLPGPDEKAKSGYVALVNVSLDPPETLPVDAGINPLQRTIANEAVRHLGTKYVWGGNNLNRGIDCSHYVAAIIRRCNAPYVPSPPVIIQETKGRLVHWKLGYALRGAAPHPFTTNVSVRELKPGDRIIIQWPPVNNRSGGRHTGIFVGHYGNIKFGVANASSSHGTTVTDLFRFWKGYRYAVRDFGP